MPDGPGKTSNFSSYRPTRPISHNSSMLAALALSSGLFSLWNASTLKTIQTVEPIMKYFVNYLQRHNQMLWSKRTSLWVSKWPASYCCCMDAINPEIFNTAVVYKQIQIDAEPNNTTCLPAPFLVIEAETITGHSCVLSHLDLELTR